MKCGAGLNNFSRFESLLSKRGHCLIPSRNETPDGFFSGSLAISHNTMID
jgi:hypothetical protein